jgi:hypothetical protein
MCTTRLSVPEVRRLLLALEEADDQRLFRLNWSRCHRAHLAREQTAHQEPRALPAAPPSDLTDAEWERVRPLLPPQQPPVGRRNHDHRTVLSGILWVLRTPAPWREMPAHFGKWNTAFVRYRLWRRQGLWQRIIDALGPPTPPPLQPTAAAEGKVSL